MKNNITSNDALKSVYTINIDYDFELEDICMKIREKCLFLPTILSEQFNINVGKKISDNEYKLYCPKCNNAENISILLNPAGANYPTFICEKCHCEQKGNSLVELVQMFNNVSRRQILNVLKNVIQHTNERKRIVHPPKNSAIYTITNNG